MKKIRPDYSFPTIEEMEQIKKHLLSEPDKNALQIHRAAKVWLKAHWENKLSYELSWLGIPVIQTAEDLMILQELIFRIRPDVIIETGIAHGGSLIFSASILELLGHGKVIGIDIDIRKHNKILLKRHPMTKRITMIEGSSIDPFIIKKVKVMLPGSGKVLILLDSNHKKYHVLKELELYSQFVSVGSYIIAEDTIMPVVASYKHAEPYYKKDNSAEAVRAFLKSNDKFIQDRSCETLGFTYYPGGFLKRIK